MNRDIIRKLKKSTFFPLQVASKNWGFVTCLWLKWAIWETVFPSRVSPLLADCFFLSFSPFLFPSLSLYFPFSSSQCPNQCQCFPFFQSCFSSIPLENGHSLGWNLCIFPVLNFVPSIVTQVLRLSLSFKIYLLESQRQRVKEIFHVLAHSLDAYNNWAYTRLMPGARNFIRVSHVSAGVQAFGSSSTSFLRPLIGCWFGSRVAGTQNRAHLRCWHRRLQIYICSQNTNPKISF